MTPTMMTTLTTKHHKDARKLQKHERPCFRAATNSAPTTARSDAHSSTGCGNSDSNQIHAIPSAADHDSTRYV